MNTRVLIELWHRVGSVAGVFVPPILALALAGCGGGSDPAASTGSSIAVDVGAFVTLDGSASAPTLGHSLTYSWTLRSAPAGSTAALASPSSPKPIFKADAAGAFVIDLTVRDATLQSAVSTVIVTATTPPAFVPPTAPSNSQPIAACQEITAPGNYKLTSDLKSQTSALACLSIHDTSGVVLDCGNHSISDNLGTGSRALAISHVQQLTVQNCTLVSRFVPMDYLTDSTLTANSIVAMPGGSWPAEVRLLHPVRVTVDRNKFLGGWIEPSYGDAVTVSNNSFTMTSDAGNILGGFVWSFYGTRLRVLNNVMDGHWDGLTGTQYTYSGGLNPNSTAAELRVFGDNVSGAGHSPIPGERAVTLSDLQYSNNIFRNNVFDPILLEPYFGMPVTPGVIIDQGENLCGKSTSQQRPLKCN